MNGQRNTDLLKKHRTNKWRVFFNRGGLKKPSFRSLASEKMKRNVIISSVIIVLVVLSSIGVQLLKFKTERAKAISCTSNLKFIDSAKEFATRELGLKTGDTISEEQLSKYCKDNTIPQCPSNGKYIIEVIGRNPKCSLGDAKAEGEKRWWHRICVGE